MSTKVETSESTRLREHSFTILHLACRLILATTFGISSIQKVFFPTAFDNVLKAYHLSSGVVSLAVPLIPLLEFALTLTLLFGIVMRTSALVAAVVLGMYTVLMGVSLINGDVNHGCGCFIGVSSSHSWMAYALGGSTITIADIIRDLFLILVAVLVWVTRNPKLGLDKFWTNSRDYWRWYHGRGYLTGALLVVLAVSTALAAVTEGNLNRVANTSLSIAQDFNPSRTIAIGQQAPDFSLSDVGGTTYSLHAYRGKVVLLEFFAIWCSNCHDEAPIINQIQKAFPASKVQILSVIGSPYSKNYETSNGTDTTLYTASDIKWYEDTYRVKNPILIDPHFNVTNEYTAQEYPNLVIIDPQGRIHDIYIGPTQFNKLSTAIQSLLP